MVGDGKARGGETEAVDAGNGKTEAEETVERKTEDVEAADG